MLWFLEKPRSDPTLRHIRAESALGPKQDVKVFQESVLLLLTRYRVFALSCLSFMRSDMFFELWKVLRALFFCLINSFIWSFHQGTRFLFEELVDFPMVTSAALIMDSEMKVVSSSIVLVSDWGFTCIKESTRVLKKAQSGFFNFHLYERGVGSVFVDKSVIRIGKWSLSYISCRIDQDIL